LNAQARAKERSLEKRGLPWRMYPHGLAYRVQMPDGRKIGLGRDLDAALMRYYALMSAAEQGDAKELKAAYIWARHRKGARQRKLEFSVTVEDVQRLLEEQSHCCAITRAAFTPARVEGVRIRPWLPSLDRIDNSQGYVPGNVRVVCGFVNVAMKAFGEALFKELIKGLVGVAVRAQMKRKEMADSGGQIPVAVAAVGMTRECTVEEHSDESAKCLI
jgi:hypothetical protein